MEFVTAYGPKPTDDWDHDEKTLTKQEFKDTCDVNKIIDKYRKRGVVDHFAKHSLRYGDFTGPDFQESQNLVADAWTIFEELPGHIRQQFDSPEDFFTFAVDEENSEALEELGLVETPQGVLQTEASQRDADGAVGAENETTTNGGSEESTVAT